MAKILFLEPYFGGSHKTWFEQLKASSQHKFSQLTLPAKDWKWRMFSAASIFSQQLNQWPLDQIKAIDFILCSEFLHIASFKGQLNSEWQDKKICCYFHENQILYPWSQHDKESAYERNLVYGYHHLENLMTADHIVFNSFFHQNSLLNDLPKLLSRLPKPKPKIDIQKINDKSTVLYPGVNVVKMKTKKQNNERPLILWNHRWDDDKNPQEFLKLILELKQRNFLFELALLGDIKHDLLNEFPSELIKYHGFQERDQYHEVLAEADILPVTSLHDFFGISVVEAILADLKVFVPDRMAYHEHFTKHEYTDAMYTDQDTLIDKIINYKSYSFTESKQLCHRYFWNELIGKYDRFFEKLSD